jgi:hypothetical protein
MVSVKKEEPRSKVHTLMLRIEAETEGSKRHKSLMAELNTHQSKMKKVKDSMPPLVYDIFTKQWGEFIKTCSQRGEHIEDLNKYFEQYLSTFMKYPH